MSEIQPNSSSPTLEPEKKRRGRPPRRLAVPPAPPPNLAETNAKLEALTEGLAAAVKAIGLLVNSRIPVNEATLSGQGEPILKAKPIEPEEPPADPTRIPPGWKTSEYEEAMRGPLPSQEEVMANVNHAEIQKGLTRGQVRTASGFHDVTTGFVPLP